MRNRIFFIVILIWACNIGYAIDADLESFVRGSHSSAKNLASEKMPNYSKASTNQAVNQFGHLDDAQLKSHGDSKKSEMQNSDLMKTMTRRPLDNLENHTMFKKADRVQEDLDKDSTALLKTLGKDCSKQINEAKNHYTKHTIQENKVDTDYEEIVCEKPTNDVTCERTLNVQCDAVEECEMGGIVKGSLDTGMDWNYTYPTLRLGTVGTYYFPRSRWG